MEDPLVAKVPTKNKEEEVTASDKEEEVTASDKEEEVTTEDSEEEITAKDKEEKDEHPLEELTIREVDDGLKEKQIQT